MRGGIHTDSNRGERFLILQAALFYLEAAALAAALAALVCSALFAVAARIIKLAGAEQDPSADIVMIVVLGVVAIAITVVVFRFYLRALGSPVAGRIVCALGSLVWALPVGVLAPGFLKPVAHGFHILITWALYLALAGVIYAQKRRVLQSPICPVRRYPGA